jgi:hypothetical protein
MKIPVELVLIVLLVVLLYQCPRLLKDITAHPLGKLVLLVAVVVITHVFGRNAGVVAALILVLLLHNLFEGMENKGDGEKSDDGEDGKDSKDSETEGDGEKSDADEDASGPTVERDGEEEEDSVDVGPVKTTADLLDSNPGDLRNKKDDEDVANIDAPTNPPATKDEPMAMPSVKSKNNKEGFALLY